MIFDRLRLALLRRRFRLTRRLRTFIAGRTLERIDDRAIPGNDGELRMFVTVRNESLRLPYLLRSYFSRGVDRVFLVDNASTDNTLDIALSHVGVHVFRTEDHYRNQGYWIDSLLRRYGVGGWSLVVDADEILQFPDCDSVSLKEFCRLLDSRGADALDAVLLDMYPERPLDEEEYIAGMDPLEVAPWFDPGPYAAPSYLFYAFPDICILYSGPARLTGGMRSRVFGLSPCISKFPLVRFRPNMFLSAGAHYIEGASIAQMRGALLHFKYLPDFCRNVRIEAERGAHWNNAVEYKRYLAKVNAGKPLRLHSDTSMRYFSPRQLVELGIMCNLPDEAQNQSERQVANEGSR